jgi:hypothetical protein
MFCIDDAELFVRVFTISSPREAENVSSLFPKPSGIRSSMTLNLLPNILKRRYLNTLNSYRNKIGNSMKNGFEGNASQDLFTLYGIWEGENISSLFAKP